MSTKRTLAFKITIVLSAFIFFIGMNGWWLYKTTWGMDVTVSGLFLYLISIYINVCRIYNGRRY